MSGLFPITEDIYEQVKKTASDAIQTKKVLIQCQIEYLELVLSLVSPTNPNYDYYCNGIKKDIRGLEYECEANDIGIQRLLLRMENNKNDEEYLMNSHLRIQEHIKQWKDTHKEVLEQYTLLNNGTIYVMDLFE